MQSTLCVHGPTELTMSVSRFDPEPMRVVLDTNVVLDLVLFDDPWVRPLRDAIHAGHMTAFTCAECLTELRRVLAYPVFALHPAAQAASFEWFAARARSVELHEPRPLRVPRCRDADDQKFLELAWAARAHHLLTKDKALLELARSVAKLGGFAITAPRDFQRAAAG